MHIFTYDHHPFPLPDGHRFPLEKYTLLRQMLQAEKVVPSEKLQPAREATQAELLFAHTPEYVAQIANGTLSRSAEREMGLPWSPELAKRVRHTIGATIQACHAALEGGIGASAGGGTHHAMADRPRGYCLFNDAIIGARVLQQASLVKQVLIIDCDVHQGDGTAALATGDSSIYTFSIHCEKNFPFRKVPSDLDVGLPVGADDTLYLYALRQHLERAFDAAQPDFVIYLAGSDPFRGDKLGKLDLTMDGLLLRDEMVFERCREAGLPLALVMAGGYARHIADTAQIHLNTLRLATEFVDDM